jgi:hypothetical protein
MIAMLDRACLNLAGLAGRRWAWRAALIALCGALVAPLALVDVPPLLDYPNHMARMFVLAFGPTDPILSRMYAPHWGLIPNLALDVLIPPALAVMPLDVAGRIAIAVAILLPVAGCLALSRALFGRRSWWALASALPAYNVALRLGLLNFLIGVGMALLLAASWVAWRELRPRFAIGLAAVGAVVVFFCHIMGVALLGLLLGLREAEASLATDLSWRSRLIVALRRFAMLAGVFVPPCALFALSPLSATTTGLLWQPLAAKLYGAFGAFIFQNAALDLAIGAGCLFFVYACLRERRGQLPRWMAASILILALCYAAAPFYFKGTGFVSTRFAVMAGFLIFAGFRPLRLPPRVAALASVAFMLLFCARMADVAAAWWAHNAHLAQLRSVIAAVEPGSRVLVLTVPDDDAPQYWATTARGREIPFMFETDLHEPALLLTERRAFWPSLFANLGQQPLVVLPPYDRIATPQSVPPPHSALSVPPNPIAARMFPVPPDWRKDFDYVLLLDAGGEPDLVGWAAGRMDLLRATDAAALFRIRKPAPG